jgi:5-methyltetrahydropteroyltriglutamate--homocysteine methyltransferase
MALSNADVAHAETIGSLLHSDELISARRDFENSIITREALQAIEDQEIVKAVQLQERLGFKVVTDGELRRNTYIDFVLTGITGVSIEWKNLEQAGYRDSSGAPASTPRPVPTVFDRIRHKPNSPGTEEFAFLKRKTGVLPKATIVGPAIVHFFGGREAISRDVYPTLDEFWADLIAAFQAELRSLHQVGCTYVQFDDTSLIKLVDPAIRQWMTTRGDEPAKLLQTYVAVLEAVIAGAPKGMTIGLHLCRGNNRGTWQAEGGYGGVAEQIFRRMTVDIFLLEFDSPRAGNFEPLRSLPDDRLVILGLLSTKRRDVENVEEIVARIREAERFLPIQRLGVSPQCGFWGGINLCTPAEAEAKLRRVIEVADRVWRSP